MRRFLRSVWEASVNASDPLELGAGRNFTGQTLHYKEQSVESHHLYGTEETKVTTPLGYYLDNALGPIKRIPV